VALRCEIIDLSRLHLLHEANQVSRVRHVAVVQEEARSGLVRIDVEVVDSLAIERGTTGV